MVNTREPELPLMLEYMPALLKIMSRQKGATKELGAALVGIVFSVQARSELWEYAAFLVLGVGWGGMIPLQEVIWASYFGRRYLGAVRSAGLPFALVLGAGSPLLVSLYFDHVGDYNGAFLIVAGLNIAASAMLLFIPKPGQRTTATAA